ncbi:DUF2243 domain-containing protein [Streptomyces flavofungini]|uniref:DUF2243 domain-containing protein n=1 Tax=Streptomyces flavofungini TaxID=68200 RepID=UPI0034DE4A54
MATTTGTARPGPHADPVSLQLPGILLGVGLGGFVDGILLHQLLRWHHMLTSTDTDRIGVKYYPADTVPGLEMNTVWDGIFHAVCWLAVLLGLASLYARVTRGRRRVWASGKLWGWTLVGWGVFNLVEGVLDHHIMGIHHVYAGPRQIWWDLGFLLIGALFVAAGLTLQKRARAFDSTAGTPAAAAGPS